MVGVSHASRAEALATAERALRRVVSMRVSCSRGLALSYRR
jgi:hypothetical protein